MVENVKDLKIPPYLTHKPLVERFIKPNLIIFSIVKLLKVFMAILLNNQDALKILTYFQKNAYLTA